MSQTIARFKASKHIWSVVLAGLIASMLFLSAFSVGFATAETIPPTEWTQTYGGESNDYAFCVIQTSDGCYVLAGYTYSFGAGGKDGWLVKTDASGNIIWNQTYGGSRYEELHCVIQTSDGGFALAGYKDIYGVYNEFWLIKTDSLGNQVWSKTFGGTNQEYAYCLVQTSDGGYAIAGDTYSFGAGSRDYWLVKTDANGNQQWNKTYGGTANEYATHMIQTSDNGYAIAGHTYSYGAGNLDYWVVKTDENGNRQWSKAYGASATEQARCILETDNGFVIAGVTTSFAAGAQDFWVIKTNFSGNQLWNRTYGGARSDSAFSIIQANDGGYAVLGQTDSYGAGNYDFWLVKTDASGNQLWSQAYGGGHHEYGRCICATSDGGYALAGYTYSFGAGNNDMWLVKIGPESPLVVPEYAFGALTVLAACFAALAVISTKRTQNHKPSI